MPWWKAADFGDSDTVVTVVTVVQDGSGDFVTLLLTSIALVLAVLRFRTPSSYARNSATWILDQLHLTKDSQDHTRPYETIQNQNSN